MHLDFSQLTPMERYFTMTQAIIPRPIAWVLTGNADGNSYNLAPYSYFTPICSDPPLVLFSAGKKAQGSEAGQPKDTARNIIDREHFVIHIPTAEQINAVQASAALMHYGESEVEQLGLNVTPFEDFALPRLTDSPIALACRLHRLDEIGAAPQAVIYGEILSVHLEDRLLNAQNRIDPHWLNPLSKLGGANYAPLGELMQPEV
ncbi:flavin reductase family protein [Thiomicrorhabdus sp.]|uniref:flavin reductase family protein n=1 Tax=Thiomicrorhabdus sp. TaxID=2039724 RepID=UPI0029C882DA|nr:flavin reductase family protein [Thiomicrorhabdus sp.]